jgi:hypothetical protein
MEAEQILKKKYTMVTGEGNRNMRHDRMESNAAC